MLGDTKMDIETKKTILDDEASIYKKRKNTYTGKDIKTMSLKNKIRYFKDYYLKFTIIILLIVAAICILVNDIVFDKSQCVLYVSCINTAQPDDNESLTKELTNEIKNTKQGDFVSVISYNLDNPQYNMSFITLTQAGTIDIAICPADYFEEAAGAGMFANLNEFLPEEIYTKLSEKIIMARPTETDIDGNIINYGNPMPYGVDISDSPYFSKTNEQLVLCILNGSPHTDNTLDAVSFFTTH